MLQSAIHHLLTTINDQNGSEDGLSTPSTTTVTSAGVPAISGSSGAAVGDCVRTDEARGCDDDSTTTTSGTSIKNTASSSSFRDGSHRCGDGIREYLQCGNGCVVVDGIIGISAAASNLFSSTHLLSFTDQGQNIAGIFFQASLLPYLLFLYFLSFRANRISSLGNFGFQFILLFVLSTIPSGIVTKAVYNGQSLANTDWLHGGAELLLTIANVFVVSLAGCQSIIRWVCLSFLSQERETVICGYCEVAA